MGIVYRQLLLSALLQISPGERKCKNLHWLERKAKWENKEKIHTNIFKMLLPPI